MTNNKEKIVALYVRVSTGYQADKDSLPFQKKELKAYCEHVLHIDKNRIEIFEDAGKSGKNTNRPGFERMMEKVKAGLVSHVIVYKIDRISRNLVDFSIMYDDFKYNDVTFISLNEQFDTSSAIGEAILKIILVFAELERKLTSERVTDVMIGRAQNGQWNGARVPYGWDWDSENKRPVHSKKEAEYVRMMYDMYLGGKSTIGIRDYCNTHNIPTKRGGEWSSKTIGNVLRNPMNKGDYRYNYRHSARGRKKPEDEVVYVENVFEPLVKPNIWDKVNKKLDENRTIQNTPYLFTLRKRCNVFSGLIICGECGANYQVCGKDRRAGSGFRPSSYVCTRKRQRNNCSSKNVGDTYLGPFIINYIAAMVDASKKARSIRSTNELEKLILSHIAFSDVVGISEKDLQKTLDLLHARIGSNILRVKALASDSKDNLDSEVINYKNEISKIDRALERLKKAFLFSDDGISEKEFLEMKSKLEANKVNLENKFKQSQEQSIIIGNADQISFIKTATQFLISVKVNTGKYVEYKDIAALDEESLKEFMHNIIKSIVVKDRKVIEIVFSNGLSHKILYR